MLPSMFIALSLNLLGGNAVSAISVPSDDYGRTDVCDASLSPGSSTRPSLVPRCNRATIAALNQCVDCVVPLFPTVARQEEGQVYLDNIQAICLAGGYNVGPLNVVVPSVAASGTAAASGAFPTFATLAGGSSPSPPPVGGTTPPPPAPSPAPSSGGNAGIFGGQPGAGVSIREFSMLALAGSAVLGFAAVF